MEMSPPKSSLIKTIYIYLVTFVGLMFIVIASADLVQLALKSFVFKNADDNMYGYPMAVCEPKPVAAKDSTTTPPTGYPTPECYTPGVDDARAAKNLRAQREQDAVRDLSFLAVGIPLFVLHWRLARRRES